MLKAGVLPLTPDDANDVLYSLPLDIGSASHHAVFFGGDTQDCREVMRGHRDNQRYSAWCLEAMLDILSQRFPDALVWIVRPNCMRLHTFAVYSTFLDCNDFGVPTDGGMTPHGRALTTLDSLLAHSLAAAVVQARCDVVGTADGHDSGAAVLHASRLPVDVVGFSKGCVVLNQLARELANHRAAAVAEPVADPPLVHRLRCMYWLDGGHCGSHNAWLTDDDSLAALSGLGLQVSVHVTPYQVRDPRRKWIGDEERKFVARLARLGGAVTETVHFSDEPPSIDNHFKVLKQF